MPTAVLVLPILPDREEQWRRFAQDLLGERLGEYEGLGRRLGVRGVRVYLARTSRREVIVAYVEAGTRKGRSGGSWLRRSCSTNGSRRSSRSSTVTIWGSRAWNRL